MATRALVTTKDSWYRCGRGQRFWSSEVVVFSDAGVRCNGGGVVEVGLGWVMLDRVSGQVAAAASRRFAFGQDVGVEDVNR